MKKLLALAVIVPLLTGCASGEALPEAESLPRSRTSLQLLHLRLLMGWLPMQMSYGIATSCFLKTV